MSKMLTVLILSGAVAANARSQARVPAARSPWADSTPARIMASSRGSVPQDLVIEVLRQRSHAYSQEKRRELGDSVATFAIRQSRVPTAALNALVLSGSAESKLGGIPEPLAMDQLIRISKEAIYAPTRTTALYHLLEQVKPSRAFPHLEAIARSDDSNGAIVAVDLLSDFAFGNGATGSASDRKDAAALLRKLSDGNLVKGAAAAELCRTAVRQKWPTGSRCRGLM